jgi:hypothetical protein
MRTNEEPVVRNNFQTGSSAPSLCAIESARQSAVSNPPETGEEALRIRQVEVSQAHRDLDDTIARLSEAGSCDELLIARLKKRKLQIKDEIARIERLLPAPADQTGPWHLEPGRVHP